MYWRGDLVVCVSYHCRVSQVESVPGEALREAVGLLSYVVFIWLNAAMWRHSLSYKQTNDRIRLLSSGNPTETSVSHSVISLHCATSLKKTDVVLLKICITKKK